MKSFRWLLPLLIAFFLVAPAFAEPPKDGKTYALTFSDDFNGTQLDKTKFNYCYRWGCGPNSANAELQGYSQNAVKVSGGYLTLTGTNQSVNVDGWTHTYTSGMVNTNFTQNGGYWEARIKFPKGNGLWGAWWTLPINPVGKWPPELDIVEFIGNTQDDDNVEDVQIVHANRHAPGCTPSCQSPISYDSKTDLTKDYHTYGMLWDPGKKITYYLDGKVIGTITSQVPNEPMYGLLNLALGGSWPGNPDASTKWPAVMSVDFVKIWQVSTGTPTTPTDPGPIGPEPCPACPTCPAVPNTIKLNCTGTMNLNTASPLMCTPVK